MIIDHRCSKCTLYILSTFFVDYFLSKAKHRITLKNIDINLVFKGSRKKRFFFSGPVTKRERRGVSAWPLRKKNFF